MHDAHQLAHRLDHELALIDTDRRRLVRAAARLLGPADAEDAVQDAYVRALEADKLQLNAAQAWLLTVVRRLAIDSLRRRQWMQQWVAQADVGDPAPACPSAENDAALAQEATNALRLLAARLSPAEGAAVLLHEVFEWSHAEIAEASGKTEAASRQQLRRALSRLRQARRPSDDADPSREAVFRVCLQSLQQRDPQALLAMLRQQPMDALATMSIQAADSGPPPQAATCGVTQVGGQLGLVLTLDGVALCVLPLGVPAEAAVR